MYLFSIIFTKKNTEFIIFTSWEMLCKDMKKIKGSRMDSCGLPHLTFE